MSEDLFPEYKGAYPSTIPEGAGTISRSFMEAYSLVPSGFADGTLTVISSELKDPYPFEAIKNLLGFEVEVYRGEAGLIASSIAVIFEHGPEVSEIVKGMDGPGSIEDEEDPELLKGMAGEAPVINLVNLLISRAIERRASDVHIEPFEGALKVRYRVDGLLSLAETLPRGLHAAVTSRVKIMAGLNIAERRLPQDGRIRLKNGGRDVDVRVSTVPTLYGESAVLRLLDPEAAFTLESTGLSGNDLSAFESVIRQPHGMVLVTGPTGSGKTTTLYAALSRIDTSAKKVITIEDPVEYNLSGVNQIQVKPRIGFTFANGLKSIVRQDPDVIMVGEIRDPETAGIAVHSALTGHLIFSTLHTNDAPGAVTRLLDMGVEGYLVSSSLIAVMGQRLVRTICPACAGEEPLAAAPAVPYGEIERVAAKNGLSMRSFRGRGCPECENTGYRGRTAITELMRVTEEIKRLICAKASSEALRRQAISEGMTPLKEDGIMKALQGVTTLDEVARVTVDYV